MGGSSVRMGGSSTRIQGSSVRMGGSLARIQGSSVRSSTRIQGSLRIQETDGGDTDTGEFGADGGELGTDTGEFGADTGKLPGCLTKQPVQKIGWAVLFVRIIDGAI